MRLRSQPHRSRLSQLGFLVVAIAFMACHDDSLTVPQAVAPPLPKAAPEAPHLLRAGEAQTLTFTITGDTITGGGSVQVPTASQYLYASFVTVTASGYITLTPTYAWTDTVHTYGPSGASFFSDNGNNVWINRLGFTAQTETDTVEIVPHSPGAFYIYSYGPYSFTLDMYQWPPHPKIECGPGSGHPEIPCYRASGSRTFTITPLPADLSVTPESTSVSPGSTPYVDFRGSPMYLHIAHAAGDSVQTPFVYDSSSWVPDSVGAGGEGSETAIYAAGNGACQFNYGPGCRRHIIGSGTFSFAAFVNGMWKKKSTHISAPYLKLTVNPAGVRTGDSATFTPSWSDNVAVTTGNVSAWSWTADAQPGATSPCAAHVTPCKTKIQESGTMKVSVTRNGVTRTATVHVIVYSTFRLDANPLSVPIGDTTAFVPKYDDAPGPAARWLWIPSDTATADAPVCVAGASICQKQMIVSGRMWAFTSTNGGQGDSDYKDVIVTLPTLTVTVDRSQVGEGDTATFTGVLSPTRPSYQVAGWNWLADGGVLASRRPQTPTSSSHRIGSESHRPDR